MFRTSFFISCLTIVNSILSFCNQIYIARYFGAGKNMDLYIAVSSMPIMIATLVSASLSYSLVPNIIAFQKKHRQGLTFFYCKFLFKKIAIYGIILGMIVFFVGVLIINSFLSKHLLIGSWQPYLILSFTILSSLFSILFNFLTSWLNSQKKFILPIAFNGIIYIIICSSVILLHNKVNVLSIAIGNLIGNFLVLGLIFFPLNKTAPKKEEIIGKNNHEFVAQSSRSYLLKLPSVAIAMMAFTVYQTVDSFWATRLGQSQLSYLGYCQRVFIAITALIISGPSVILAPKLSSLAIEQKNEQFLKDLSFVIKLIIVMISCLAIFLSYESHLIVKVIFERGVFSSEDTNKVAGLMPFFFCAMIFMGNSVIIFRALFAKTLDRKMLYLGVVALSCYFFLSGIFSEFLNINGIALALLLSWIIVFFTALKFLSESNFSATLKNIFFPMLSKQLISLLVAFIFLLTFHSVFNIMPSDDASTLYLIARINLDLVIFLSIYFFLSYKVLKQYEIVFLFRTVKEIFKSNK